MRNLCALLLCSILATCQPAYALDNFQPGETVSLTAGTSTGNVAFVNSSSQYLPDVMISNAGTGVAFFNCGVGSGTTAALPGSGGTNATPILAGETMTIRKGPATYCAGITASGSDTLYFTPGQGG